MNARTTLILGVIAIILIAYLVISNQTEEDAAAAATVPPVPTTAPRTRVIPESETTLTPVRLEVSGTDDNGNLLERTFEPDETGIWAQVVPTYTQLISGSIVSQANGLLNISSRQVLQPDENPVSAYGLDEPLYTIAVEAEREAETVRYVFLIGNQIVGGTGYYLQLMGDPRVYIVDLTAVESAVSLLTIIPVPAPVPTLEITSTLDITETGNITNTIPLSDTVPVSSTLPLSNTVPVTTTP
jgi:hypothetical protein